MLLLVKIIIRWLINVDCIKLARIWLCYLVKIFSTEFCNTKLAGLGKLLSSEISSYSYTVHCVLAPGPINAQIENCSTQL